MRVVIIVSLVLLVLGTMILVLYVLASEALTKSLSPWQKERAKRKLKALKQYVDTDTREFYLMRLLRDAGAPYEIKPTDTQFCLPKKGEYLSLGICDRDDLNGSTFTAASKIWRLRRRMWFDCYFGPREKIWSFSDHDKSNYYWISAKNAMLPDNVYITERAIMVIYDICNDGRGGFI